MDEDIAAARRLLRRCELSAYLPSLFWNWRGADAYVLAWGFIRWADEIVDTPGDFKKKTEFIDEQIRLARSWKKADVGKVSPHQRWMIKYLRLDEEGGYGSAKYFISILESLKIDSLRRGKVLTKRQYEALLLKRTVHPRHMMYRCVFKGFVDPRKMERFFYDIGMSHTLLDDIADMEKDLKAGHINLFKEELKGKSVRKLDRDDMKRIVAGRRAWVERLLGDAERVIRRESFLGRRVMDGEIREICNLYDVSEDRIENSGREPYAFFERVLPRSEPLARLVGNLFFPVFAALSPYGKRWLRKSP